MKNDLKYTKRPELLSIALNHVNANKGTIFKKEKEIAINPIAVL
jgi:hypothetical protein